MALSPKDMFATRFMEEKLIELYQSSLFGQAKKLTIQRVPPSTTNKSDSADFGTLDVCYSKEMLPKLIKEGLAFTMSFNIKPDRSSYSVEATHSRVSEGYAVNALAEMIAKGVDDAVKERLFIPSRGISFGDRRNDFTIDVSHNTMNDEIAVVIRGPKSAFEELPTGIQWLFTAWNAVKYNKRIECVIELLKMMLNLNKIEVTGTFTGRFYSKTLKYAHSYSTKKQKLP